MEACRKSLWADYKGLDRRWPESSLFCSSSRGTTKRIADGKCSPADQTTVRGQRRAGWLDRKWKSHVTLRMERLAQFVSDSFDTQASQVEDPARQLSAASSSASNAVSEVASSTSQMENVVDVESADDDSSSSGTHLSHGIRHIILQRPQLMKPNVAMVTSHRRHPPSVVSSPTSSNLHKFWSKIFVAFILFLIANCRRGRGEKLRSKNQLRLSSSYRKSNQRYQWPIQKHLIQCVSAVVICRKICSFCFCYLPLCSAVLAERRHCWDNKVFF